MNKKTMKSALTELEEYIGPDVADEVVISLVHRAVREQQEGRQQAARTGQRRVSGG